MARDSVLLDMPIPPDQRITSLHAWIAVHENGAEGIMSADLEVPEIGMRHIPLIASRIDTARRMEPLARKAAAMSRTTANPVTRIDFRSFVLAETET